MRQTGVGRGRPGGRRVGFTLMELLVVVGIIVVLAALAATATFKLLDTQRQSNTEALLRKVDHGLQQMWSKVVEEARAETPSPSVMALAGGDLPRARVMWIKFRLVEAFPMSFTEILNSDPVLNTNPTTARYP